MRSGQGELLTTSPNVKCSKSHVASLSRKPFINHRPPFCPLPLAQWFETVHANEILSHLDELKGVITSTFGRILKLDSTKKVNANLCKLDFIHVKLLTTLLIVRSTESHVPSHSPKLFINTSTRVSSPG